MSQLFQNKTLVIFLGGEYKISSRVIIDEAYISKIHHPKQNSNIEHISFNRNFECLFNADTDEMIEEKIGRSWINQ